MNRRGFLKLFTAGVAGIALEQAIPLGRVWSFPSKIAIANPLGIEFITAETLEKLRESLVWYETESMYERGQRFKVGSTIRIRMPQRWLVRNGVFGEATPFEAFDFYSGGPPTAPPVAQLKSGFPLPARGMPES